MQYPGERHSEQLRLSSESIFICASRLASQNSVDCADFIGGVISYSHKSMVLAQIYGARLSSLFLVLMFLNNGFSQHMTKAQEPSNFLATVSSTLVANLAILVLNC